MMEGAIDPNDKLNRTEATRLIRRLAPMLVPYRRDVTIALVLVVVWTSSILAPLYLVRYGIDSGIGQRNRSALYIAVGGVLVAMVVGYAVSRSLILVLSRAGEGLLRDLRTRVFHHLTDMSMSFFDRSKAGVLVSRMTSDVDSMAELVQFGLVQLLMNILLLVFTMVSLAFVSWQLLLLCLIALPFVVLASVKFQRDANAAYLGVRDHIGATLSRLQEGIAGVRVIQAFAREDDQLARFHGQSRDLLDAHMKSVWVQAWYLPVIELAGFGTTAVAVGAGGWLVVQGTVSLGDVTFFLLALNNLFEPVQQLSQLFNTVQSAGAGLRKLFELLDTPPDVGHRPGAVDLPISGMLVVNGVSFAYADGPAVLRNVSIEVPPGEKLALVGPTGAGKSTLAKLMARFYDPTQGSVSFGGVDLQDATAASLRERIVVIPQEGFLFAGSIRDNVRIARSVASDRDVDDALRSVGAYDRFSALPEGLDTPVRDRGARLSAGERQLVSLARAALVDPAVLVLDEATSSLDPGTEQAVEAALTHLMEGRTVVVIAHRLSTSERADRVGVVADGELAELGSHTDLVAEGGRYAALFSTWSGGAGVPTRKAVDGQSTKPLAMSDESASAGAGRAK